MQAGLFTGGPEHQAVALHQGGQGVVAATDPDQCTHVADFTKSPFNLAYDAASQGKISTLFARFKTRSGPQGISQAGPWSAPLVTHVA